MVGIEAVPFGAHPIFRCDVSFRIFGEVHWTKSCHPRPQPLSVHPSGLLSIIWHHLPTISVVEDIPPYHILTVILCDIVYIHSFYGITSWSYITSVEAGLNLGDNWSTFCFAWMIVVALLSAKYAMQKNSHEPSINSFLSFSQRRKNTKNKKIAKTKKKLIQRKKCSTNYMMIIKMQYYDVINCRWINGKRLKRSRTFRLKTMPNRKKIRKQKRKERLGRSKKETTSQANPQEAQQVTNHNTLTQNNSEQNLTSEAQVAEDQTLHPGGDLLRGGAGGSDATAKRRDEKLLEALTQVLQNFGTAQSQDSSKGKGKGKGKHKGQKGEDYTLQQGKKKDNRKRKKNTLIEALTTLVTRFATRPKGDLLQRLNTLVQAANSGKLPTEDSKEQTPKAGKGGKGKGKETALQSFYNTRNFPPLHSTRQKKSDEQTHQKHTTAPADTTNNSEWIEVVKKNKRNYERMMLAPKEWSPGDIISDAQLRQALERGEEPKGRVAWCRDGDFAQQCRELAQIHGITKQFALVTSDEQAHGEKKHLAVTNNKHKHGLQEFFVTALSDSIPELPASTIARSTHTPAEEQLTVFRASIPQTFLTYDQWNVAINSPGKAILTLVNQNELHSTYGWKATIQGTDTRQTTVLEGYFKVSERGAQQVQERCGRGGVFARPLNKCNSSFCSQPIEWIKKAHTDSEQQYFNNCQQIAKDKSLPLAWRTGGGSCLGIRFINGKDPPPTSTAWRVTGAPNWYRDQDLTATIRGAGWTEVMVLHPPRKRMGWLIKAIPPAGTKNNVIGIETGVHMLLLAKAPPRNPRIVEEQRQKTGTWWKSSIPQVPSTIEDEEQPAATQMDTQESQEEQDANGRRPPQIQPAQKKKIKVDILQGFKTFDAGGQGSCGYNSVAAAYFITKNPGCQQPTEKHCITMGKTLRQQIKQHVDKNDADYKAGWAPDPTWTITTEGGTVPTTWGEWKNSLLREKRWICHRTLQAAANRLGVHITVLVDDGTNATPIQLRAKSSTKDCIVLHLHNKHYKPWPTHWVQETDTTSHVPRAGMDVTPRRITKTDPGFNTSSRKRTAQEWMPSSTPKAHKSTPGSSNTAKSSKYKAAAWMPSSTPRSRPQSSTGKKVAWMPPTTPQSQPSKLPSSQKDTAKTNTRHSAQRNQSRKPVSWTCPHCEILLEARSKRQLSWTRSNHMRLRHLDIPLKERAKIKMPPKPVPADPKLTKDQRDWTCPWCEAGLPKGIANYVKKISIKHHYATKHARRNTLGAAGNKQRAKNLKKDYTREFRLWKGNKNRAETMRYKSHLNRDYSAGNHNWVAVMPDFEKWPNQPKSQKLSGVVLTCTKCRRLTQNKKETYRTCKGSQARPSVQQAAFWKKLTKFPENMQLFLNAWRTTKQEADKKFERLPQQGIETNPGPIQSQAQPAQTTTGTQHNGQHNSNSSSSEQEESGEDEDNDPANIQHKDRSTCRVLTINTGGAPGVWRILKRVVPFDHPEVVCIQEASLTTAEFNAVHKKFHSLGYSAYYSKGQHTNKVTGGVLTAIRREIPHSTQYTHTMKMSSSTFWFKLESGWSSTPTSHHAQVCLNKHWLQLRLYLRHVASIPAIDHGFG